MIFLRPGSWLIAGVLLFFTLRRWLFILAALCSDRLLPDRPRLDRNAVQWPPVVVLVPARNEAETLPDLLAALARLDYPPDRLAFFLLNDASTDGSEALMAAWAAAHPNRHLITMPHNVGKARALNVGLARAAGAEIIAVYDADERPQADALCRLVAAFADVRIGAASGRRAVSNPLDSPAAAYATFEGLVHQLVTMRAKDRLNLSPAVLGANCAYRRTALKQVGAFRPGALLEDSDLSLKLPQAGWQIRFVPEAVSYHAVPTTLTGYWKQHTRWARGFNDVARERGANILWASALPLSLRLELAAFAAGYLDRLALVAAAGLILLKRWSQFPLWVMAASLLTPLFQTVAALKLASAPAALWRRLLWLPFFFGIDIAMAASGFWGAVWQKPQLWEERRIRQ